MRLNFVLNGFPRQSDVCRVICRYPSPGVVLNCVALEHCIGAINSDLCPRRILDGVSRTSGIAGFCAPVLQALEGGRLIRTLVAAFMRIEGVVVLLGMLALAFGIGKNAFNGEGAQQITAMIVLAVMRVLFGTASFLIQFYRAASVESLGESHSQ